MRAMKMSMVVLFTTQILGCASGLKDAECSLTEAELAVLQPRIVSFLSTEWPDSDMACEEITKHTQYIDGFGCGLYAVPRMKGDCPAVLDGDYWIIYSKESLTPIKWVGIAY